mgnify:CR=1 FL=1
MVKYFTARYSLKCNLLQHFGRENPGNSIHTMRMSKATVWTGNVTAVNITLVVYIIKNRPGNTVIACHATALAQSWKIPIVNIHRQWKGLIGIVKLLQLAREAVGKDMMFS